MTNWLSPYAAIWRKRYPDSDIPFKQLAQALRPLTEVYPTDRIAQELDGYLEQTPAQYVSIRKFTMTFGRWQKKPERRPYSQSVDDMDRNAGIIP